MGLIIKHLSTNYVDAELAAWRNLCGLVPSVIALWSSRVWHRSGRQLKLRQWKLALLQGVVVTCAQLCFYMSLGLMAFATASTITYASALFTNALAVPILKEQVGFVRWCAVLIGFVGVIMVIQPGTAGFSIYALLPLAAAVFYALVGVTARLFDDDAPSPLVNLYASTISLIGATSMTYWWGGFSPVDSINDMGWIALMSVLGGTAVLFLVVSCRMTEQSNLAPFNYFVIPLAFVLGWLFFDKAPWSSIFSGALLIVWRERLGPKSVTKQQL